jgi:hypothetical protein
MTTITASLSWSLDVDCPSCEEILDLAESPYAEDQDIAVAVFNNKWDALKDYEITCQFCKHEFKIDEIEY